MATDCNGDHRDRDPLRLQTSQLPPLFTDETRTAQCQAIYLPIAEWEIRLLVLLPGEPGEPLRANLRSAALTYHHEGVGLYGLHGTTSYEALSYTWGQPLYTHLIIIGDHTFSITGNLHEALTRLRKRWVTRILWVDALCINQSDPTEKSTQVGHMFRIYQKAMRVIVWLGKSSSSTQRAITFARSAVVGLMDIAVGATSQFQSHAKYLSTFQDDDLLEIYLATQDIFNRPWLHRLWVVQEVTASTSVKVYIGEYTLNWQQFVLLGQCWTSLRSTRMDWREGYHIFLSSHPELADDVSDVPFSNLLQVTGRKWEGLQWDPSGDAMLRLLEMTNHARATDDRDRIYALFGMLSHGDEKDSRYRVDLQVDYTSSVADVYTNATLQILNSRQDFTLLHELEEWAIGVGRKFTDVAINGLPSWVPDWRDFARHETIHDAYIYDPGRIYILDQKDGETTGDVPGGKHRGWTQQSGAILKFGGMRVAEVDIVLRPEDIPDLFVGQPHFTSNYRAICTFFSGMTTCLRRSVHGSSPQENWYPRRNHEPISAVRPSLRLITKDLTCMDDHTNDGSNTRPKGVYPFRNEAAKLFESDRLAHWLRDEVIWHVPSTTKSGDLFVACARGWPLILRPRQAGGWVYVGHCKPEVPNSQPGSHGRIPIPLEDGLEGLTPLFQDLCKWARPEDIEHFIVF